MVYGLAYLCRIGTSALEMALKRRNNTMIKLLLTNGASRFTICECVCMQFYVSRFLERLAELKVLLLRCFLLVCLQRMRT